MVLVIPETCLSSGEAPLSITACKTALSAQEVTKYLLNKQEGKIISIFPLVLNKVTFDYLKANGWVGNLAQW